MPRPPRIHVPAGFYHISQRGNYRQRLFTSAADRDVLNSFVAAALEKYGARCHGFCWMSNHIHLLLQVGNVPTGEILRPITSNYARYRHRLLNRKGHLFERRYHASLIDENEYFQVALRYVHMNPVHAGMVTDPAAYRWSSHRAYLGLESIPWLTTDFGLSTFGITVEQARAQYSTFMRQASSENAPSPLHPLPGRDPRILGSDVWAAQLPVKLMTPALDLTLEQMVEQVCRKHGVSVDTVRSASRARNLAPIRAEMAAWIREYRIATLAELGAYLHRDPSGLSQLLARYRPCVDASSLVADL